MPIQKFDRSVLGKSATLTSPPPKRGEHYRTRVSDTWDGIRFELGRMVEIVKHSIGDPLVVDTAKFIIAGIEDPDQRRNPIAILAAQYDWIRGCFQYVSDPVGLEVVQTPQRMLRMGRIPSQIMGAILSPIFAARNGRDLGDVSPHEIVPVAAKIMGDCDEASVLCATLPAAVGIRTRFRLGGSEGMEGYHHVWAQADPYGTGAWGYDMDPTEKEYDELGKFAKMHKYANLGIFD